MVKISVDGPCTLRAGAIQEAGDGITIINKEQVILTITDSVKLNMRLTIESGSGYEVNISDQSTPNSYGIGPKNTVGLIPIDASFCPIKRVIFDVGHSRLGRVTDYDRLHIFVETNGAVTPERSLSYAAKVLRDQLTVLAGADTSRADSLNPDYERSSINEYLNLKIEELELSVRSQNCLKNENIACLGDLVQYSESQMLKMPNFGKKSLMELKGLMAVYGLAFGMKVDWVRTGAKSNKKEVDSE